LKTAQDLAKEQIKCPICCAEKNHSCTTPIHKKSKPKIHPERLDEYHTQVFERITGVKK